MKIFKNPSHSTIAGLLVVVVIVAVKVYPEMVGPIVGGRYPIFFIFGVPAAIWLYLGTRLRLRHWRIKDTPTSVTKGVAIGTTEVYGQAVLQPETTALQGPASGAEFVWYHHTIQEHVGSGKSSRWATRSEHEIGIPFLVEDAYGTVTVDPIGAEHHGLKTLTFGLPGYGRNWRQREYGILVGGPVYVYGYAQMPVGTDKIIIGEGAADFIIAQSDESQVQQRFNKWSILGLLAGLVASILAISLTFAEGSETYQGYVLHDEPAELALGVAIVAVVYLTLIGLSWLMRTYNRLIRVRNQGERSWGMVEVELARRQDLIKSLIGAASGYKEYERETLVAITEQRMNAHRFAEDALPQKQQVVDATQTTVTSDPTVAKLLALAEAYPQLKADSVFMELQQQLMISESRLGYAREYYNESIGVLRTRRETFPANLVARYAHVDGDLAYYQHVPGAGTPVRTTW